MHVELNIANGENYAKKPTGKLVNKYIQGRFRQQCGIINATEDSKRGTMNHHLKELN
jgi:hypothetical protein